MSPSSILTYRGLWVDVLDPATWVFDIRDIAQSLSLQCRYNGHIDHHYSVAEHSVEVARELEERGWGPNVQLLGLLHDGVEAFIGDLPGPWKKYVSLGGRPIAEVEQEMENSMFHQFGLQDAYLTYWSEVKDADHAVYEREAAARPRPGVGFAPDLARDLFLEAFNELMEEF